MRTNAQRALWRDTPSRRPVCRRRAHGSPCRVSGFLLLEVLVAATVLVVGVVAGLQSLKNSLDSNRLVQDYSKAIFLTEQKMWELQERYGFRAEDPAGQESGRFERPNEAFRWKTVVEADPRELIYRLHVETTWDDGPAVRHYRLQSEAPMPREHGYGRSRRGRGRAR